MTSVALTSATTKHIISRITSEIRSATTLADENPENSVIALALPYPPLSDLPLGRYFAPSHSSLCVSFADLNSSVLCPK